jgi:hypothetical protein
MVWMVSAGEGGGDRCFMRVRETEKEGEDEREMSD